MPGRGEEVKGSVKETAGKAIGNEQMEAEGKADRLKGKSERETAGAANRAAGALKEGAGKVIGDEQMEAEGKARNLKGKAQQAG